MNFILEQETYIEEIEKIKKMCKDFYAKQDFAHDERHASRVSEYAKNIMKFEKADFFLVVAGSWLHQFHDNLDELEVLLKKLSILNEKKELLFHM